MKLKLAIAFAVMFFAIQAHADSQPVTVDLTATNCLCGLDHTTQIDLSAQLTVEQVTGTFFQPNGVYLFTGTVYEIVQHFAIPKILHGGTCRVTYQKLGAFVIRRQPFATAAASMCRRVRLPPANRDA
jgi:hypothetical protein